MTKQTSTHAHDSGHNEGVSAWGRSGRVDGVCNHLFTMRGQNFVDCQNSIGTIQHESNQMDGWGIAVADWVIGLVHADEVALAAGSAYNKGGFVVAVVRERLWVLKEGSKRLSDDQATDRVPDVSAIGAGLDDMTSKSPSVDVLCDHQAAP